MKIGIQLWGALNDTRTGTLEALRRLRALGFDRVEPCVSVEPIPGLEHVIWPMDWFAAHAGEIADMGLEVVSCHIFAADIAASAGAFARMARELGVRQFVVKSPAELTDMSLQQAAMNYMRAADALAGAGAELLLHNERADIAARLRGKTAYEYLLDLCLGKVGAQVDVGWALAGGEDPEALLWRNAGRVRSLHFKDFVRSGEDLSEVAPGAGAVDTAACLQFARAFGCTQVLDMDGCPNGRDADYRAALGTLRSLASERPNTVSYLNTLDVETGAVRTLARFDRVIEAPNWLKGEDCLLYNSEGRMYRYDIGTGAETLMDTGLCDCCNNDHVVSPDERFLAVSHMTFEGGFTSRVYVVPMAGGEARLVTPNSPSFLHGWSPDGGEMAYCAFRERDGRRDVDVYTIPAAGGEERRLTFEGFNDGPEYSPDGEYIWFNSTRSGLMQLWRMRRDGSGQTQMTFTERNNWFGHVSPDGRRVVYLSYGRDDLCPDEHLPNMRVELWLMNADGSDAHRIASFFGGQGSMNVNSWAADSRRVAFVSYGILHR